MPPFDRFFINDEPIRIREIRDHQRCDHMRDYHDDDDDDDDDEDDSCDHCDFNCCYPLDSPGPYRCARSFCHSHARSLGPMCVHPRLPGVVFAFDPVIERRVRSGFGRGRYEGPREREVSVTQVRVTERDGDGGVKVVGRSVIMRSRGDGVVRVVGAGRGVAVTPGGRRDGGFDEEFAGEWKEGRRGKGRSIGDAPWAKRPARLLGPPGEDEDEEEEDEDADRPSGGGRILDEDEDKDGDEDEHEDERRRHKSGRKTRSDRAYDDEKGRMQTKKRGPLEANREQKVQAATSGSEKQRMKEKMNDDEDPDLAEAIRRSLADVNLGGAYEGGESSRPGRMGRIGGGRGEEDGPEGDLPPRYEP